MIKILTILSEIKVVSDKKIIAKKSHPDMESRGYFVNTGGGKKFPGFTIWRHKNHASVYPTFQPNSKRLADIISWLKQKNIVFKEKLSNNGNNILIHFPFPKQILFLDFEGKPINEIKVIGQVTPKMIMDIWHKFFHIEDKEEYYRKIEKTKTILNPKKLNISIEKWLEELNQLELKLIYKELLNIYQNG